jgi:PIN domain nuclease of toxin-antitoxin system
MATRLGGAVILYLDTQVAVWLAAGEIDKISPAAAESIRKSDLLISPMVLLELEYLYEIKRLLKPPLALLNEVDTQIGLKVADASFSGVLHTALFETWTHDPFDRVIVAHARTDGHALLATSDVKIRDNYPRSVW